MEILILLYLAHYLGDYPLQTGWVYAQKIKNWSGGVYHALGITFALLICLAPFLYSTKVLLAIFCIVITHYFQDAAKLIFNKTVERELVGYFGDQSLHLLFSTFYWFIFLKNENLIPKFAGSFYLDSKIAIFLIGLILVTYVLEITIYVIKNANKENKKPLIRDWKQMIKNALVYSFFWTLALLLINI